MTTPLDLIHQKIAEYEAKIADLRIAARAFEDMQGKPRSSKTGFGKNGFGKNLADDNIYAGKPTIGSEITAVLRMTPKCSSKDIASAIQKTRPDIGNRAVSFALQAMKKRALVKTSDGLWSLTKKAA